MLQRLKNWYNGKPYENDPDDLIIILGMERHWTAEKTRAFVRWLKVEWKFLVTTSIAIIGLIIAYLSFVVSRK